MPVQELVFLTPIVNVSSILKRGILCNRDARKKLKSFRSIANPDVQAKRAKKKVHVGLGGRLHTYANLYICGRNPMTYDTLNQHQEMTILRVHKDVLKLPNVVVSDGNAASDYTRFELARHGLDHVDMDAVFARDWRDPNQYVYWEKKRQKCAEILVPGKVPVDYIFGAYVVDESLVGEVQEAAAKLGRTLEIVVNKDIFFK